MPKSNPNSNKKVFVAMSGGVDSSVAAAVLKLEGYDVTGVYMKNWSGEEFGIKLDCPWEEDLSFIDKVCTKLDIPYMSYNFEKEYKDSVIIHFFNEYKKGRTPNPDVLCNKEIKFGTYLEKALKDGADLIATGHYVRSKKTNLGYRLLKGLDPNKDQSYFLYRLGQFQLSKSKFPLGGLRKTEVRKIARDFGLANAERKDSQGICFIGKLNVPDFLRENLKKKMGEIIDADSGSVVGEHDGIMFYTIGQREGLGIGGAGKPYFVVRKDIKKNIIYVAKGNDNKLLFRDSCELEDMHWISGKRPMLPLECEVSVRYRQKPVPAILVNYNGKYIVKFDKPVRAVAPGQSLVVYRKDSCLGGGTIK